MKCLPLLLAGVLLSGSALAAGYTEKKSGDLSNDRMNPTSVTVKSGSNVIAGNYGTNNGVTDRDYFTIRVPKGQVLDSIVLSTKTKVGGNFSFIGVQKGRVMTVPPDGGSPADLLGWTHYGTADEGTDILPAIGQGNGAKGFTPPLPSGYYTFWVQELATCACNYNFVFHLSTPAK